MRSAPIGAQPLRGFACTRAPARAAPVCTLRSAESSLSRSLLPATSTPPPPSAGGRTVFMRSLRTQRAPTASRSPLCRIKTSSASCARPARAAWRYACPPRWASAPQGAEPVGRAYAGSRRSHGFRPFVVAAVAASIFPPNDVARRVVVAFATTPVTRRARTARHVARRRSRHAPCSAAQRRCGRAENRPRKTPEVGRSPRGARGMTRSGRGEGGAAQWGVRGSQAVTRAW